MMCMLSVPSFSLSLQVPKVPISMAYALKHNRSLDLAELALSGTITGATLREAATQCVHLQRSAGVTRFLIVVNGEDVQVHQPDIDDLVDRQYRQQEVHRSTRIAVIRPAAASAIELSVAYESACRRRGWQVRICADREAAIEWLVGRTQGA